MKMLGPQLSGWGLQIQMLLLLKDLYPQIDIFFQSILKDSIFIIIALT